MKSPLSLASCRLRSTFTLDDDVLAPPILLAPSIPRLSCHRASRRSFVRLPKTDSETNDDLTRLSRQEYVPKLQRWKVDEGAGEVNWGATSTLDVDHLFGRWITGGK